MYSSTHASGSLMKDNSLDSDDVSPPKLLKRPGLKRDFYTPKKERRAHIEH